MLLETELVRFDLISSHWFFRGKIILTYNNFQFWLLSHSFTLNIPFPKWVPKMINALGRGLFDL